MDLDVVFTGRGLVLPAGQRGLPGLPEDGEVRLEDIRDADPDAAPPEVRTAGGLTLFVTALQRRELTAFCGRHAVPLRRRPDVWADLLGPFLDTEETAGQRTAALERLSAIGLDEARVTRIRERVAPLMIAYNALHWDWHHLGLCDLLDAAAAPWIPERVRRGLGDLGEFRVWAMRIADIPTAP
ncbi:hypothetical protein [Bailinhaonella thermotolerans]|uniref:Uncharacterized protein n=1 Tax=Bailinhaonella thermotolerans TaxID=1070861 RepID=A0A3A4ARS7_9ACTN|nr:hypothetical protein [Bailinhaonella thermotolerans]RJL31309.1 hypothetical protein D5H75_19865 [Bailinhaonella thermotolerans]